VAASSSSQCWHRIVVKVGTSTLTAGTRRLSPPRMVGLVRQLAGLRLGGHDVVLVSSGAQQAGRERLGYPQESKSIPFKQMLAAVGQGRLMRLWEQYFDIYDLVVAQVLMTREDVENRRRYLNLRDTFDGLLQRGIVPIVNENDAVATDEIQVGENDSLSAMVANAIEADLLILLTDRDGVYTADPEESKEARLIPRIDNIDEDLYALAKGSHSGLGRGGMYTKILAAEDGDAFGHACGDRERQPRGRNQRRTAGQSPLHMVLQPYHTRGGAQALAVGTDIHCRQRRGGCRCSPGPSRQRTQSATSGHYTLGRQL